ncbi:uncharacterized protein P174DRAFT_421878 [Aspergillus novofumigatus IBT 16806]|uniref:SH3 domain-containing protein n=1 Tax=Aspergillus novofumigatus (strain IBT 16806) TaxID=1392255 RepID=A0A2I1C5K2_ASPN1|nr:uncharacterized protein P174DRAFT_421878 [Aspergillus novofumigatus IBT 16806]PKX92841.1 hypothetical protein P174DRAFT_421878 [Aspergillus novofumigatus IBT 16806]
MTSVTASLPVEAQGSKYLSQKAPGRSHDDGMYHPGNARLAVAADPSHEYGNTETKPIATTDAMLDGHGSSESGMLRGTITDTLPDPKAAAVKPRALPSEVPLDLRQGHFDHPLQLIATMTTSTNASSSTTSSTTSYNSTIRTTLHTVSMPTSTRASSTTSASHATSTSAAAALRWETMTPAAQAGIVISAVSLAIILIGMIFWWLHRKKRALLRAVRGEEAPPPTEKQNPAYRFASNLYTSSTSTLVNVTEIFKASREKSPSINDRSSSIYSNHQPRSNLFTLAADKVRPLRGRKQPPDRRSRYSHGYVFAQEFEHVPPPPPTRLQKIVAGLYANGSSTVKTVTAPFKAQPPPQKDNASSTWSSMSSRTPYSRAYDSYPQAHQFQPPCDISNSLDLVKVRSVSSGTVAMSDPAEISVDAMAGRISGEGKRHQEAVRESSPSPSQSTTAPCQRQSPPPPRTSREGSPAYSGPAPSQTQLEVPSVKLWTKQVYRVDMDFTSRSDGQLQVGEGQMVRLEQIFDDGWALCTLTDTEKQGLLPRACLSTWPIKERRHYASSSNTSERALGVSPTDSQSFRFYRQHSRPGTPKPGTESKPATESKPPSVKKQSISPTLSTFFRL